MSYKDNNTVSTGLNRRFQNFSAAPWKPFQPAPNASAIAAGIDIIPEPWALVPLQDKAPKRNGWESGPSLSDEFIKTLILDGEEKISKKTDKTFRLYASGYGIRTGAVSGGILAIDVDGPAAHELLQHISADELPKTVSFTSGKPGRYQLLFQIPTHLQPALEKFTRKPIRKWGEFESNCDLDFRYNEMQSCLPPSRHPDTGAYKWINSPADTEVAEAPEWLCNLLKTFANEEKQARQEGEQARQEREARRQQRRLENFPGTGNLIDRVEQAGERLGQDIYDWLGHNFKKVGKKLVGHCPQHGGESGTAFQVNPQDWSWFCHGCGVGGHAVQYRHFVKGGKGTPTGQEYVAIACELIEDAGLPFPEIEREPQQAPEPDPELYTDYEAWESQQELIEEEADKERKRQWAAAQSDRTRGEWTRLSNLGLDRTIRKLTKEICERYLNIDPERDFLPGINAWASPMGTGKTHNMAKIVERFPEGNIFSYRNSLLINTTNRIPGVDFIHDLGGTGNGKADRLLKSHSDWTALCVDSITKVRRKDVLVLEEASKLIDHVLRGATCKRERAQILRLFQEHIQAAKYIFLLDADLSDTDIRYIKSLAHDKPIHVIKNVFQPWQWQVNWFVGKVGDGEGSKPSPNDRSLIEKFIIDSVAAGLIPAIASDSQVFCEATNRLLTEIYGDSGLRVDSQTKTDDPDKINAFLADPNKWIEENKPAWFIYSPTAESSLDITIEYFTDVFAVFFGVISCYSMRQMLGRYRVPVPRHVFVRERSMNDDGGSRSPFAKTVLKHLHQYENATLNQIALDKYLKENLLAENDGSIFTLLKALQSIADFESETWNDPQLRALGEYQARNNYQKSYSRQTLREMLERDGHQIREITGATQDTTGHKRIREDILRERAERIATAKDISIEEAREIQRNMAATTAERYAAKKAILKDICPGIEVTPDFVYWEEFENRGILTQLQNYFMWQNPGLSETVDRQRWTKALGNDTFLADIRTQSLELKTLNDLGIGNLLDGKERGCDDPEVLAIHQRALARAKQIKTAFGINVKPDSDINYLLKRILGKVAIKYNGKQRRTENGERTRLYSAVLPETEANCRAVLAAYAIRYADLCQQKAPMVELSQTGNLVENILLEQSVTIAKPLPNIEVELLDTTVKGLPPVELDQPIGLPEANSTVVWLKSGINWVTFRRFLSNKLALIETMAGKFVEVSLDELQWAEA